MIYARGDKALALCDVCGLTYKLKELKKLVVRGKITQTKACPECWSPDQPQLMLGTFPVIDPQALFESRPDVGAAESRALWGWDPVYIPQSTGDVGQVTIS